MEVRAVAAAGAAQLADDLTGVDVVAELISSYPKLKEIVWVQEEPRNMGAWSVMQRRMPELLPEGVELGYVGRPPRASPGEGYAVAHTKEQERIVLTALMGRADPA